MPYKQLITTFIQQQPHQVAIIFGLGREGWSTFQFLRAAQPSLDITLVDDQPLETLADHWQQASESAHTHFMHAAQLQKTDPSASLPKAGTVFKTPGIPPTHPLLSALAAPAYVHSSNTQLFFEFVRFANSQLPAAHHITTIGVTGTKGKSTTATLIKAALSQTEYASFLGGNIGTSPLDLISELSNHPTDRLPVVVLELSCHQLADLTISPHLAVIQNITPEHLDYYPTVWHYVAAKSGIVRSQQTTDTVICSSEFSLPQLLAALSPGHRITHQVQSTLSDVPSVPPELRTLLPQLPAAIRPSPAPRVECISGELRIDGQNFGAIEQLQTQLKLFGEHNRYNLLAAIATGVALAIEPARILKGLHSFQPLAHRLQLIAEKNNIRFVNDSLATTPEAAAAAIASFADSPVILIAGGHDRHLDFAPLTDALIKYRVKGLVLFPPTGEFISETLHKRHPGTALSETQYKVTSMPEAVQVAAKLAKPGDVVLLSPASASFGAFRDYQDRGEQFVAAVEQLVF